VSHARLDRHFRPICKVLSLGADAVFAGRAPLYGVAASGAEGVERAVHAICLLGARSLADLGPALLQHDSRARATIRHESAAAP